MRKERQEELPLRQQKSQRLSDNDSQDSQQQKQPVHRQTSAQTSPATSPAVSPYLNFTHFGVGPPPLSLPSPSTSLLRPGLALPDQHLQTPSSTPPTATCTPPASIVALEDEDDVIYATVTSNQLYTSNRLFTHIASPPAPCSTAVPAHTPATVRAPAATTTATPASAATATSTPALRQGNEDDEIFEAVSSQRLYTSSRFFGQLGDIEMDRVKSATNELVDKATEKTRLFVGWLKQTFDDKDEPSVTSGPKLDESSSTTIAP